MRLLALLALVVCVTAGSAPVFKIEVGEDYKEYSQSDLKRRVWELERAVWQLQQKVFQLEAANTQPVAADTWFCSIDAMGVSYPGTGTTRAIATVKSIEACKAGRGGDGFFCKDPKCNNQ